MGGSCIGIGERKTATRNKNADLLYHKRSGKCIPGIKFAKRCKRGAICGLGKCHTKTTA